MQERDGKGDSTSEGWRGEGDRVRGLRSAERKRGENEDEDGEGEGVGECSRAALDCRSYTGMGPSLDCRLHCP